MSKENYYWPKLYYRCKKCGEIFTKRWVKIILMPKFLGYGYFKCPKCNRRSWVFPYGKKWAEWNKKQIIED